MIVLIKKILRIFERLGEFTIFSIQSILHMFTPPFRLNIIVKELVHIGVDSILIISLSNFAIGMIISFQISLELTKFSASDLTINVLAQALTREIAPIITSLMMIAKNGSAFTAEIGSMKNNEQINALKTMNVNPIQYLVSPKLFACAFMFPILTGLADIIGMVGGSIVTFVMLKMESAFALNYMFLRLEPADIITGLLKSFFMGIIVCLICCYKGLQTEKGSEGVGRATTQAVVAASITILVADLILGQIIILLGLNT